MAYAAAVSIRERRTGGRLSVTISVTETEARDTSEWSTVASAANTVTVNGQALTSGQDYPIPRKGRIVLYQADRTAGTGATIQPRLGKTTGWSDSTMSAIGGQALAADYVNDATPLAYAFTPAQAATLFGRSTPNSTATDHAISTLLVIERES